MFDILATPSVRINLAHLRDSLLYKGVSSLFLASDIFKWASYGTIFNQSENVGVRLQLFFKKKYSGPWIILW